MSRTSLLLSTPSTPGARVVQSEAGQADRTDDSAVARGHGDRDYYDLQVRRTSIHSETDCATRDLCRSGGHRHRKRSTYSRSSRSAIAISPESLEQHSSSSLEVLSERHCLVAHRLQAVLGHYRRKRGPAVRGAGRGHPYGYAGGMIEARGVCERMWIHLLISRLSHLPLVIGEAFGAALEPVHVPGHRGSA